MLNIQGDSGSGKSLFVRSLANCPDDIEHFGGRENRLIVSYDSPAGLRLIKNGEYREYSLVVIDNADVLLNDELCRIISKDLNDGNSSTYWVVMCRKYLPCCDRMSCWAYLKSRYDKNTHIWRIWNTFKVDNEDRSWDEEEMEFI